MVQILCPYRLAVSQPEVCHPLRETRPYFFMYYVYILKSKNDGTCYIGYTHDLRNRITEHSQGKTKSIRHKLPVMLVYYEAYLDKTTARKREVELKKNSFKKKELFARLFPARSSSG